MGNGDSENDRKNAFEVLQDGRAKVQTAPTENDDVVRKLELDDLARKKLNFPETFDYNEESVITINDVGWVDTKKVSDFIQTTGGTMTGKLVAPQIETGTGSENYFQCSKFRGQGDANTYYHAIDFGYAGHDHVDFHEYGGLFNFYRNTAGTADGGQLIGSITDRGFVGGAELTGTPTAPTAPKGTNTTQIATT